MQIVTCHLSATIVCKSLRGHSAQQQHGSAHLLLNVPLPLNVLVEIKSGHRIETSWWAGRAVYCRNTGCQKEREQEYRCHGCFLTALQ